MSTYNPGAAGLDITRIWKQFLRKLWLVILMTFIGAFLGFMIYSIYSCVKSGNTKYRISNDYYITLDYDSYPNGPDYYNAYTWDGILRDDPIVEYALTLLPGVEKQQILDSVEGEILGDYRILTVIVTGTDQKLVKEISDAYKQALPHFGTQIDMISHIDVWTDSDMVVYDEYTRDGNAAFLGGLIGLLISVFALWIGFAMDDGIYSERDWVSRYPDIPYLGEKDSKEAEVNTDHILGGIGERIILPVSDLEFNVDAFNKMRASEGVILLVTEGADKGAKIDKAVYTLGKQDIKIDGMMTVKKAK